MEKREILDLLEEEEFRVLLRKFRKQTGMSVFLIDQEGKIQLGEEDAAPYCRENVWKAKEGKKRCVECFLQGAKMCREFGKPFAFNCHGGLAEFAAPVIIDGEVLGSFVGGQVLRKQPNSTNFLARAEEFGMDGEKCLRELEKMPIVGKKEIDQGTALLGELAELVVEMAADKTASRQKAETLVPFTAPEAEILVVDDDDINYAVIKGLIRATKIRVAFANSGFRALEMAEKKTYDMVLMDHMMPGMDGIETTYRIRESCEEYARVPFLIISSNVTKDSLELFQSVGMQGFVGKPLGKESLLEKIRQWLPDEKIRE